MIKFVLLLRYTSCRTYMLLLEQLLLPSLFEKMSGIVDTIKVAKLLLEKNFISDDQTRKQKFFRAGEVSWD